MNPILMKKKDGNIAFRKVYSTFGLFLELMTRLFGGNLGRSSIFFGIILGFKQVSLRCKFRKMSLLGKQFKGKVSFLTRAVKERR